MVRGRTRLRYANNGYAVDQHSYLASTSTLTGSSYGADQSPPGILSIRYRKFGKVNGPPGATQSITPEDGTCSGVGLWESSLPVLCWITAPLFPQLLL